MNIVYVYSKNLNKSTHALETRFGYIYEMYPNNLEIITIKYFYPRFYRTSAYRFICI